MGNLICLQKIEYNGISEVICPKNKDLIIDKYVNTFPLLKLVRPIVSNVFDEKFIEYLQNMEYLTTSNLWQVLEDKELGMDIMYDLLRTFIPANMMMVYNDDRSKILGANFFNEFTEIEHNDLKNLEKCKGKHMYKADRFVYINRGFNVLIKLFDKDYFDRVDITEDGELTGESIPNGLRVLKIDFQQLHPFFDVHHYLIALLLIVVIVFIIADSDYLHDIVQSIKKYANNYTEGGNEQNDENQKFDPKRWLSHDDEFYRLHAQYFVDYATEEQEKSAKDLIKFFNIEYFTKEQAKVLFQIAFDAYMEHKDLKAGTSYKEIEGNFLSGLRSTPPVDNFKYPDDIILLLLYVASYLLV